MRSHVPCQERKCADVKPRCAKEQLVTFSVVCKTKDQLRGQALRLLHDLGPGDAYSPTSPISHQRKPHVPSLKESWVFSMMNNSSFLILPLCMTSPSPILCLERSLDDHSFFFFSFILWVFIAAHGLSLAVAKGSYSSLSRAGFSSQCFLLLQSTGSRHTGFSSCGPWALELGISSCEAQA